MFTGLQDLIRAARIARKPDRLVLVNTLFKALAHQSETLNAGRQILWLGVQRYTQSYYRKLEAKGAEVWTLDLDPSVAIYGREGRHATGSATALGEIYEPAFFDVVFCNGVIGWGVDSEADRAACFAAMAEITKPGGILILGWNSHKTPDPLVTQQYAPWFAPYALGGFGARLVVQGVTHVFDVFRRE